MQTPPLPRSSRPRIGIPVRLSSSSDPDPRVAEANELFDYIVELVRDGGGEPVLLSSPEEPLEALDGVVLPGGGDLDPRLYGEEPGDACYDVSQAQDGLDLAIARRSIDAGLPVLGICRGHQLLNVLYGGTLLQDMDPGTVPHREPVPVPVPGAGPWAWHEVEVRGGTKVAGLYGRTAGSGGQENGGQEHGEGHGAGGVTVKIASGHHQAVARVADGLVVTAVAEDGTVEALEDPDRWVASVQWHPEALELPAEQRLAPFRAFADVCRSGNSGRIQS
ncbi:gamma-glutamyl-gamma-aminobutyrate hydrolase family protein [Arthrobacter sp. EPSL27]|uniref:gamma-glutamyl-gamma-aminobutyrate hydrolase family protein n=1 Tax=Arthrobacter sp. EPSL27 TaxID=1745378 RepID=UPI00074AB86D|nr:gamma-glutamyl-gamma-aminobutyrate hydrolase family protein [Arthrobacter sp. EPSL27]KUM36997.1 glutamine amidotransferase [Arthrobacter sp. EPSL27]